MASPQLAAGYRHLLDFTREDLIAIHDEVASLGRTWDIGVRDSGTIDYVVERIRSAARARLPPVKIAAEAMVLIVREHPFWDGNHRTDFQVADSILRAFGRRILAKADDAENSVRSIDASGAQAPAIRRWIARHTQMLR